MCYAGFDCVCCITLHLSAQRNYCEMCGWLALALRRLVGGSAVDGVTKMPVALMDLLAAHQLKEALLVALW
jgi:hypothetical protein